MYCARDNGSILGYIGLDAQDRISVIFGLEGISKEHPDIDNCSEYHSESHGRVVQLNFLVLREK